MPTFLPVVLVSVLALAGCARFAEADRDARATAVAVHKQTVKLKQAVRQKVEAEERYYRGAVEIADKSRRLQEFTDISRALLAKAQANAADLQKNPEMSREVLAQRLQKEAQETLKVLDAGVAARREQREALRQNLQALRDLQSEYNAFEQSLVQLSTAPDQRQDLRSLLNFITHAAEHYRKLDESQRKAQSGADAKKGTP